MIKKRSLNINTTCGLADSHAHIIKTGLEIDPETILDDFFNIGGRFILNVGYSPESNIEVLSNSLKHNKELKVLKAIGLHPDIFKSSHKRQSTGSNYDSTLQLLKEFELTVSENLYNISAIGETGLDYYQLDSGQSDIDYLSEQREVQLLSFRKHLELAERHNLPLTIHTRGDKGDYTVFEDAIKTVAEFPGAKGAFHSFTGPVKYAQTVLDLGFYIGFNGILSYKSADDVSELCKFVPLDQLLLETDTPYLPTNSVRNDKSLKYRLGQPKDILEIGQIVAEIKELPIEKVLERSFTNFQALFI